MCVPRGVRGRCVVPDLELGEIDSDIARGLLGARTLGTHGDRLAVKLEDARLRDDGEAVLRKLLPRLRLRVVHGEEADGWG